MPVIEAAHGTGRFAVPLTRRRKIARWILVSATIAFVPGYAWVSGLTHPIDFDESYHIETIREFHARGRDVDLRATPTATTPLYHILAAVIIPTSPARDIRYARGLTVLLATLTIAGLGFLCHRLWGPGWAVLLALIVIHPNFLWYCFLVMTEVPSLCFAVLVTVSFLALPPHTSLRIGVAGVLVAAAIWTRQSWVFLSLAFVLSALLAGSRPWRERWREDSFLVGWLGLLLALPIFLYWGGLTPPREYASEHRLGIYPQQVLYGLLLLGSYFPFIALRSCRRSAAWAALALVTAGCLFLPFEFLAGWSRTSFVEIPQGPILRAVEVFVRPISAELPTALLSLLIGLGVLVTYQIARTAGKDAESRIALIAILSFVAVTLLIPYTRERYWFLVMPLMTFVVGRSAVRSGASNFVLSLSVGYLVVLGAAYFVYQINDS